MATLLIMCGLSFSGKTTLAQRIREATGSAIVSYDELYATVDRDPSITGLDEWYLIVGLVQEQARAHLAAGRSVVVDSLNEEVAERGTTSDENFRFVLSRFEAPAPRERHVRFGPDDDVEEWVQELRARVFAEPADG